MIYFTTKVLVIAEVSTGEDIIQLNLPTSEISEINDFGSDSLAMEMALVGTWVPDKLKMVDINNSLVIGRVVDSLKAMVKTCGIDSFNSSKE